MIYSFMLITLVSAVPLVTPCPPASSLSPCVCDFVKGTDWYDVTCPGLQNEQAIAQAVFALKDSSKLSKFTIRDGVFRFIPQDAFKGIRVNKLQIMKCTIMALTDTDQAFSGLEDSLISLVVHDSMVLNDWDWKVLRNLKSLQALHVDVDLDIVSEDMGVLGDCCRIMDVNLADNRITFVVDNAFANFASLAYFSLRNNMVSEVKRSMFPNPAHELWQLDFGNNQLENLPPDLFENMPKLGKVSLKSNKILSLSESTFAKVWPQLKIFDAMGNQLRCDCRLEWITKAEKVQFPEHIQAVCEFPLKLKGKNLLELTPYELLC